MATRRRMAAQGLGRLYFKKSAIQRSLLRKLLCELEFRRTDKEELNGKWATVCPPIIPITESLDGCVGKQLADDDTQIDTCRGDASKDNR